MSKYRTDTKDYGMEIIASPRQSVPYVLDVENIPFDYLGSPLFRATKAQPFLGPSKGLERAKKQKASKIGTLQS